MVPPDSHRVSRAQCYSGYRRTQTHHTTGLSPSVACLSRHFMQLVFVFMRSHNPGDTMCLRFRLFRVRSPLLTESRLISLPVGTEMCHFPTFAEPLPMDSGKANPGCPGLGCPIRGSPDKLVCSIPGLIAAYHALHRLSAPRHPPYTLSNLPTLIRFPEGKTLGNSNARRLTAAQRVGPVMNSFGIHIYNKCSDVKTPRLSS